MKILAAQTISAIVIQTMWRALKARQQFKLMVLAQRDFELMCKLQNTKMVQFQAACKIQAKWKAITARHQYQQSVSKIISLQSFWRFKSSMTRYSKLRRSSHRIAHWWRAVVENTRMDKALKLLLSNERIKTSQKKDATLRICKFLLAAITRKRSICSVAIISKWFVSRPPLLRTN